jgi:alanine racemase
MSGTFSINQQEFIAQAREITKGFPTIAVVKNNAYNYGLIFSVKRFLDAGIRSFAVTNLDEAIKIRDNSVEAQIFLMNPTVQFDKVRAYNIDITLPSYEYYENNYERLAGMNIHIEYAGMFNRSGLNTADEMFKVLQHQESLPPEKRFNLTGLWTHFGYADEFDGVYEQERKRWQQLVQEFKTRHIEVPMIHAQNTASFMRDSLLEDHTHLRLGVGLYGGTPYPDADEASFVQSCSLSAPVIQIRHLPAGTPCGYGGSFIPQTDTKVAVVDIGYGDGVLRSRAAFECEINGRTYPIRSLMMSHMIVEVDHLVSEQDIVYLYNKNLRIDDFRNRGIGAVSEQLGALNYQSLNKVVY